MDVITDPVILMSLSTAIAVAATIYTLVLPLLERDKLGARMRYVATEREKMRARARAEIARGEVQKPVTLRTTPKDYMRRIVSQFNLRNALADEATVQRLRMAGYRGEAPLVIFLFARFVLPIVVFLCAIVYLFGAAAVNQPTFVKILIALLVSYAGFYAPNLYVSNVLKKRQTSIKRSWPDALDLLLICAEAGMSIEHAFKKVADEIGTQSIPLAEELTLTTAELNYLSERRQAYENLGSRTGLEGVRAVTTSLIQAERYGTPVGTALRTMAQENRDMRMNEAEKKAAALPPKLTVPMILFFLPVLFAVILGPAAIQIMVYR